MSKRSIEAKKKKRLEQLRDAQRRRREKLKNDSRHFVQIILPESTLQSLRVIIATTGETMQQAIARLVLLGLENSPTDAAHDAPLPLAEEAASLESVPVAQQADYVEPEIEPDPVITTTSEEIAAEIAVEGNADEEFVAETLTPDAEPADPSEPAEQLEDEPETQPETIYTAPATAPPAAVSINSAPAVAKASDQLDLFG